MTEARRIWILAATMATLFISAIEGTIIATAMPSIVAQLGDFDLFSLVFTAYLLTQAVTIPIYGRLADLFGRKHVLFVGIGFFLVGSVMCGFAWGMASLVAFRIVQGIGAGALVPVSQTIVGDIYPPAERARIQGYVSSVWAVAAIIGPVLGAFLVAHVGWPWVFWVNVPIGLIAALMLALTLHEQIQRRPHRIDAMGSVLIALAIGTLVYALTRAATLSGFTFACLLAAAAILLTALFFHESRAPEPMLPLDLWRDAVIATSNVGCFAIGGVIMGMTAFLPAYVQGVMGLGPIEAGYALTAMSITWAIGSATGGKVMLRSSYRAAATLGGLTLVAGALMMITLTPERGLFWSDIGAALTGMGMGLVNNTFQVATQASVAWNRRGIATSSIAFARILGQTVGTAVFGGILNFGLADRIGGGDIVNRLMNPALRQTLPAAESGPVTLAIAAALHDVYLIVGVLALLALAASLYLPAGLSPTRPARSR
jgi:EmrB/QacA subfamily drug resistance transporter